MQVKGEYFGVRIERRSKTDSHAMVILMEEDDGAWYDSNQKFDSHWLPELIRILKVAQEAIQEKCEKSPRGLGYKFKSTE